jgi:hypothetical protein
MSRLTCPYCRAAVSGSEELSRCGSCGAHIAWLNRSRDFVLHGVDLWRVLRGQRQANLGFLLIALTIGGLFIASPWLRPPWVVGVVVLWLLGLHILLGNGFYEMLAGYAVDGRGDWRLVLLATVPGVNAIALVILNLCTWRSLSRVQMPWRPFGWSERAILDSFARAFCRNCGYNLTGNVSGRCPECGTPVGDLRGLRVDSAD